MRNLLLALILTCTNTASATFEGFAEAIYARLSTCDLGFAISDARDFSGVDSTTQIPQGDEQGTSPEYDWGYRVGLGYECNCYDVRLTYSRLSSCDRVRAYFEDEGGLWIGFADPAFTNRVLYNGDELTQLAALAVQRDRLTWQGVDLMVGSTRAFSCKLTLRGSVGLHYVDLVAKRSVDYQGTVFLPLMAPFEANQTHRVISRSDSWGVGPRVGVDWRYELLCGFGLGGCVNGAVLTGRVKSETSQHDVQVSPEGVTPPIDFTPFDVDMMVAQSSRCVTFPELDASIGVNYLYCCGNCFMLLTELGYEWRSYIKAMDRTVFNDSAATSCAQCTSFNLNGLYLRFHVRF